MNKEISQNTVARWYDPFITFFISLTVYFLLKDSSLENYQLVLILVFSVLVPMFILEFKNSPFLKVEYLKRNFADILKTSIQKYIGFLGIIFSFYFLWWLAPIYESTYHIPLYLASKYVLPFVLIFGFLLIFYTEKKLGFEKDYLYYFGKIFSGKFKEINFKDEKTKDIIKQGVFASFVKFFFLPMNFCTAVAVLSLFRGYENNIPNLSAQYLYFNIDQIIFFFLLIAIIPGYLFSSKLLNTHIRKVDTTWTGWIVTLAYYTPLNAVIFNQWFKYKNDIISGQENYYTIFSNFPIILYGIIFILILMAIIHYWAEAILGIRASNLTNRGVIVSGPFAFSKHPIYLSKNIGFFLIALPFLSGNNFAESLGFTIAFGIFAFGFYLRCHVEERLFASDETYVKYALEMDKKGALSFLNKYFPMLSFEYKYKKWKEKGIV
jgi:protein-S-isoprenylcysteine O-methyltransferase Ste14